MNIKDVRHDPLVLLTIILLITIGQFATEVYLPSMPNMASYFKVPITIIQLSITTYALGYAFGSFSCGYLSDKLGRLTVLTPCLIIGVLGSLTCCLSFSIDSLLIGRFIQGIGMGGVGVIARSLTRDVCDNQLDMAKISSILSSCAAAALALAPIIGGYIERYLFWRINFIVLLLFAIVTIFLSWNYLPETNSFRGKILAVDIVKEYGAVLGNRPFLLYNCISSLALSGLISYQTISAYLLQVKCNLLPNQFGYTALVITISLVLGGVLNSRAVVYKGSTAMLKLGVILMLIAGSLYVLGGIFSILTLGSILLPIALFSFSAGIVYPNASSGALVMFADKAGTASSIYNGFQMLGAFLGSGLISILPHESQLSLGIVFVSMGLVAMWALSAIPQNKFANLYD